ncbi:MAG: ATP-binding protein, partial [Bacteroidales bacterium]|nr:ATP-binding protein [Bacteroidales bacterium]
LSKGLRDDDYQSLMEVKTDGIAVLDEFENVKYANKVASILFGTYPKDLTGQNLKDFLSEQDLSFIQQETEKRKKGESSIYELQILRADKKPCFILVTTTPKFDKLGNFIETLGFFRDITDKRKAEEALRLEQDKIKNILNSLQDLIFIFNDKGYYIDYLQPDNINLLKRPEEFIGKHVSEILPKEIADTQMKAIRNLKKTDKVQVFDYMVPIGGVNSWFTAQISRLKGSAFQQDLYLGVVRDITIRKNQEEKLKQSEKDLKAVIEDRNKLISIMAHDLKNPFAAMLGMSEMLSKYYDSFSDEKRKEYLSRILVNTKNIQSLLENTLQWSLNEQNRLSFDLAEINVGEIVGEILRGINVMLVQKEIEVLNNIPEDLSIVADEQMIRIIFSNLITNAYKFSKVKGLIEVNFENENGFYEFSVVDFGIGMSPTIQKTLFAKDYKSRREGTEGEKGTGLGLVLCKEFVQRHGGEIWVESTPNERTSFRFTIKKNRI